eukprot:CAMPEP_0174753542 /NCGR_PEP_ID=MMETSP1094-20130205/104225_1 /TAXON_ID=156173 /ORGANISM="Chrysochromulina brevifilum, Strain UTEX LB 985" /LENGTH=33 /DNA_ID= /DNA_START= /DNA_END= /DNA_ORIENTATION=
MPSPATVPMNNSVYLTGKQVGPPAEIQCVEELV